jgi:hypothetical protein
MTELSNTFVLGPNALVLVRGASKTVELTIVGSDKKPVDLTGATLWFTVKERVEDRDPLILKRSTDGAQIAITQPFSGKAEIYLFPGDTAKLEPQEYVFDVWVVLANGKRYPVIPPSTLAIVPSVTVIS